MQILIDTNEEEIILINGDENSSVDEMSELLASLPEKYGDYQIHPIVNGYFKAVPSIEESSLLPSFAKNHGVA